MALAPGTRLGAYEVNTPIGAGGMGEVYRATDSHLKRSVAIKVLPASVAGDADRLARFQREAEVLAALNHPNIAAIYGLEKTADFTALVMELVEGDDLSQRIARGAIPLEEALPIAKQIADALEAAHEQGIIHRDLKPANIKVRADGMVKVLDFGLAKALDPGGASSSDALNSPTMTARATQMGMILGTAAYMAPEQARGKSVDKRADIWAFGVVLYEMLTARPLFPGETVTDTLAAVLTREIDWPALPASTPPAVKRLLIRCLERDPKKRLRDIGDAQWELDRPDTSDATVVSAVGRASAPRRLLPWAVAAIALVVAGGTIWNQPRSTSSAGSVTYANVSFPRDVEPLPEMSSGFGVSPDGRRLFMIGAKNGLRRLFLRSLDSSEVTEISDPSGVNGAAFSPDGANLVLLIGGGVVTRLSLADRQRTIVTTTADISGSVVWGEAGIVFSRNGALWMAPSDGGPLRALTTIDPARHEVLHDSPVMLPGGRVVLFSSLTNDGGSDRIEAVTTAGGARSIVLERATTPVLAPTGHLLFARDQAVFAIPISTDTGVVHGNALPIFPAGLVQASSNSGLCLRLSATGSLVMVPVGLNAKGVWSIGRDGSALAFDLPRARYQNPRVSPDGRRLLMEKDGTEMDILDLARGTVQRLSPAAHGTNFGTWNASGDRVVVRVFNTPLWVAADGSGKSGPVRGAYVNNYPSAPGPDPDSIFMVRIVDGRSGDISLVSINGAFEPKSIVSTPAYDGGPTLSPDGRWLAFMSTMSGQAEVYIKPYPALDHQWTVSAGGGTQVRWSRDGREIYYRANQQLLAVPFNGAGIEPVIGKPVVVFADTYDFGAGISIPNYDVTRDGRFIMTKREVGDGGLQVVLNWTTELRRLLAAGGVH